MQALVACGTVHERPQLPQWVGSEAIVASQPSSDETLQSAKPAAHAPITQAPVEHVELAFGNAQAWPHMPQSATLARRSVSQPFARLPSQLPKPGLHATPHVPPAHAETAFGAIGHEVEQVPQWEESVVVFTQLVPQTVERSGGQLQTPLWHVPPPAQGMPHAPQFALLLQRSTHAPPQLPSWGSAIPSQSSSIPLHAISVVPCGTQLQIVPRPGMPAQLQLLAIGQSVGVVHIREQRPIERHVPLAQFESIVHGAPTAPGGVPASNVSPASKASPPSKLSIG